MKKYTTIWLLPLCILFFTKSTTAQSMAAKRAAGMGKGVNFSLWLESTYPFFCNPASYPDNSLFNEQTVKEAHAMCFSTIRVPVLFEAYDIIYPTPVTPTVIRGLNQLDSIIAWAARYNMNVVVDNHIPDDITDMCSNNLQALYGITDANYQQKAANDVKMWKQIMNRLAYTNPEHVFYELRNEPNGVSDVNVHTYYQILIDSLRQYNKTHTFIVGNSGYYDVSYLAASQPYADTNLIYTFHTYTPFTETNQGGEGITNIATAPFTAYPDAAQKAAIRNEFQLAKNWSVAKNKPVILGEFGSRTMAEAKGDHNSRCEWIQTFGEMIDSTHFPFTYWDYNTYSEDDQDGTGIHYRYGIFDNPTNDPALNTGDHLFACFKNALHLNNGCVLGFTSIENNMVDFQISPNPATNAIRISTAQANADAVLTITDVTGQKVFSTKVNDFPIFIQQPFTAGVYFVEWNGNGVRAIKKLIVE